MSNQTQQHDQQAGQAFSQDEFSALLNKEFRPKTRLKPWRSRRWKTP